MNSNKIIFFDIDGTLLSPLTHTFEESTKQALKNLRDQGYLLGVATGRGYDASLRVGALDLIDWDVMVLNNGQKVFDKNKNVIYSETISHDTVKRFIYEAHKREIAVLGQSNRWHLYSPINEHIIEVHQSLQDMPVTEEYRDDVDIYSLIIYGYDDSFMDQFPELRSIDMGAPYFDVILNNTNKAKGIKEALKLFNISDYVAIGDSLNDLEMAQEAQVFVATYDAHPDLVKHADYQVNSPGDEIEKALKLLGVI